MPDRLVDLLHRFLVHGRGRLSKRAREGEFAALRDDEIATIESFHAECFRGVLIGGTGDAAPAEP